MGKGRFEAFSDGVIAIIITIMVLELRVPHGDSPESLIPLLPKFLSYLLSFVFLGIYWNNHHHMLHAVKEINGKALWANLHLLFWLSLIPFATAWMGENQFTTWTVALYGFIDLMAAIAFNMLAKTLMLNKEKNETLSQAFGKNEKGKLSLLLYALSIGFAFVHTLVSLLLITAVAVIWFVPDSRIEKKLRQEGGGSKG